MRTKLLVAACSSAVFVALAALLVPRLRGPLPVYPDYETVKKFDPTRVGGHLLPDQDLLVASEKAGVGVRWITNSKGFRNDHEFEPAKPPGTYRVLFLGDSFVDGHRTDQEKTIGRVLERALNRETAGTGYERCEVMISGHNNPTNAWYAFQEHLAAYAPDLVLLGISLSNDLTWNSYEVDMLPVRAEDGTVRLEWTGRRRQDGGARPDLLLPERAFCDDATLARRMRAHGPQPAIGGAHVPDVWPGPLAPRHLPAAGTSVALGLYLQPTMPELEEMIRRFEDALRGFAAAAEHSGSRMLVVIFPIRVQVYESDWLRLVEAYALDEEHFDLGAMHRRIERVLDELGVPYVDPLPELKRVGVGERRSFYRPWGDQHLNEPGQALVAELLLPTVRAAMDER